MSEPDGTRSGEITVDGPVSSDASITFVGRLHTPWRTRDECPRQGRLDGPACKIEVFAPWDKGLSGLDAYEMVEVLYWLDLSRRDLLVQNPKSDGVLYGAFALRSPVRPNPIGTALVRLLSIDGSVLTVLGLDCVDGTPLVDLKPDRCAFTPKAPPKAADA